MHFLRVHGGKRLRIPSVALQRGASIRIELDAFGLQQEALGEVPARPRTAGTDRTPVVDDPVPGHGRVLRKRVQSVADQTGLPGETGQGRYVAVGQNTPARDAVDHRIDPVMSTFGLSHLYTERDAASASLHALYLRPDVRTRK